MERLHSLTVCHRISTQMLVTSANLSKSGLLCNIEAGVITSPDPTWSTDNLQATLCTRYDFEAHQVKFQHFWEVRRQLALRRLSLRPLGTHTPICWAGSCQGYRSTPAARRSITHHRRAGPALLLWTSRRHADS